jgi:LAO/AO transport system kinase
VTADTLAKGIVAGDRRALARGLTLVEAGGSEGAALLDGVRPRLGRARRIGVTGPPGAGKSSLVNALLREARTAELEVAVLAVDPSSPFSGGALLGDRVRMSEHALDRGVFIRSQASRLAMGGLAATSHDMTDLLDAAGFDLVVVETVGVGQSELEIVRQADVTAIVLAPSMGDMVQAMKAGLVEAGDVVVVNKGDLPGAASCRDEIVAAFGMTAESGGAARADDVLLVSAATGDGVKELLEELRGFPTKWWRAVASPPMRAASTRPSFRHSPNFVASQPPRRCRPRLPRRSRAAT